MFVEIDNLKTIKNFANLSGVTAAYIYKMINKSQIIPVIIDGVCFIDISVNKINRVRNRKIDIISDDEQKRIEIKQSKPYEFNSRFRDIC